MSSILLNKELIEVQRISKIVDISTASSKALLIAKNKAQAVDILLKLSSSLQNLKLSTACQVDEVTRTILTIVVVSED